ncbi:MAG: stilbene synthase [Verrucomicrobia bacterium]|nr:stilbene synthase [Verrucomicrobiota bacterium]
MFLTGLATAVPPHRFTQWECWAAIQNAPLFPRLNARARAILQKVLTSENGVETRHFALAKLTDAFDLTPDALHARFAEHAPALALQAAERALANARITPREVDAVVVSTCTGYLCPGLSSYVCEGLGLRPEVLALDLVGQGCGAALPNLRAAHAVLQGGARQVLSICVEICSAAFYLDDDPGVLVSDCLFGDGAAAGVLSAQPAGHARRVEWKAARSLHSPKDRNLLRFEQRGGMLRNILSRQVPTLAARHAKSVLGGMLQDAELTAADLTGWILHAGGQQVLGALQKELCLSETDLLLSAGVLREFGNLSSPFVLFVLEKALAEATPGGWWWMLSFGAGFSCHGALLKVD